MIIQRAGHRILNKLTVVVVGLLAVAVLVVAAKFFFKGFVVGVAVTLIACIIIIIWMKRSVRGDK